VDKSVLDLLWNFRGAENIEDTKFAGIGTLKRKVVHLGNKTLFLLCVSDCHEKVLCDKTFEDRGKWNKTFTEFYNQFTEENRKRQQELERERLRQIGRGDREDVTFQTAFQTESYVLGIQAMFDGDILGEWKTWNKPLNEVYLEFPCGGECVITRSFLEDRLRGAANSLRFIRSQQNKPRILYNSPQFSFYCRKCEGYHKYSLVVPYPKV